MRTALQVLWVTTSGSIDNIGFLKGHYKLPKLLMAFERGKLSQFNGMTLDEINVDPNGKSPYTHYFHHFNL